MLVLNAPMLFSGIWYVVKPWLEPRTQKKIHVISCPRQSRKRLHELIPRENLLPRYGGTDPTACPLAAATKKGLASSLSIHSDRISASVEDLPELCTPSA